VGEDWADIHGRSAIIVESIPGIKEVTRPPMAEVSRVMRQSSDSLSARIAGEVMITSPMLSPLMQRMFLGDGVITAIFKDGVFWMEA